MAHGCARYHMSLIEQRSSATHFRGELSLGLPHDAFCVVLCNSFHVA